ncbi:MAG: hypothetical protein P9F19_08850 [Candidatus Contendobacter sp.]|nr:hypothetical protein [Candidatus Contendobacter sp.]
MDNLIPVKTAKALLAISQRSHDLPRKLRTLLILINGKANIDSLKKDVFFIASLKREDSLIEDMDAMLSELKQLGLIEFAKDQQEAALLIANFQEQYNKFSQGALTLEEVLSASPVLPDEKMDSPEPVKKAADPLNQWASRPSKTEADSKIEKAKKELETALRSIMGNDYALVANKVASCNSFERFKTVLHGIEDIIQNYGSRKTVDKLKSQFKDFY